MSFFNKFRGLLAAVNDYRALRSQMRGDTEFPFGKFFPIACDRYDSGGVAKGAYFHQDLYVARRIFELAPEKHVDVGSRVDGFVAHVASFRPIEVYDIRPLDSRVHNVTFRQADFMNGDGVPEGVCDSVSSLHAIEHFGLGRYGDPIDAQGWRKGFANVGKLLRPGGVFHFAVPIGPQRIEFNAHRVFGVPFLLSHFSGTYRVERFSYVDDAGDFHENVSLDLPAAKDSFGCYFGCGIFELRKT